MEGDQSPEGHRSHKRPRTEEEEDEEEYDTGDDISFLEMDLEYEPSVSEKCPMCHIDAVIVPHSSSVTSNNDAIRQIMNLHVAMAGNKPEQVIYERMAEEFNRTCWRQMNEHGHVCEKWTCKMVRIHMTKHVPLVPRILLHKYVNIMDSLITSAHKSYQLVNLDETDEKKKDTRSTLFVKRISECVKTQLAVVSKYRECLSEDAKANGAESLWISTLNDVENDNTTEQIMIGMYQNQSTVGPNDRPMASTMFDAV